MGQVGTCGAGECPLENSHAGESKVIPQSLDWRRDGPKVLGNDRQRADPLPQDREQFSSGSGFPCAAASSRCRGRHMPEPDKAQKVIESNRVEAFKTLLETCRPPTPVLRTMRGPAIVRMPPQLTVAVESIWWSSGHGSRLAVTIKIEQFRVLLDISGIQFNEERQIPDQSNLALIGISSK
ncbi:MAG: hypothetical protein CMJ39_03960 [Phycisphaerae bacterium]|nr:hypothetical protein [Phycisphaerae bacterium]